MTNELLIASSVLQWAALCAGGIVLLGIARQVGLLHERSAPLGAMITDHGPGIGDNAPTFSIASTSRVRSAKSAAKIRRVTKLC